jgi:hypothetical protein
MIRALVREIWNIRGVGGLGRMRQLREIMGREQVEIVWLQETFRKFFQTKTRQKLTL